MSSSKHKKPLPTIHVSRHPRGDRKGYHVSESGTTGYLDHKGVWRPVRKPPLPFTRGEEPFLVENHKDIRHGDVIVLEGPLKGGPSNRRHHIRPTNPNPYYPDSKSSDRSADQHSTLSDEEPLPSRAYSVVDAEAEASFSIPERTSKQRKPSGIPKQRDLGSDAGLPVPSRRHSVVDAEKKASTHSRRSKNPKPRGIPEEVQPMRNAGRASIHGDEISLRSEELKAEYNGNAPARDTRRQSPPQSEDGLTEVSLKPDDSISQIGTDHSKSQGKQRERRDRSKEPKHARKHRDDQQSIDSRRSQRDRRRSKSIGRRYSKGSIPPQYYKEDTAEMPLRESVSPAPSSKGGKARSRPDAFQAMRKREPVNLPETASKSKLPSDIGTYKSTLSSDAGTNESASTSTRKSSLPGLPSSHESSIPIPSSIQSAPTAPISRTNTIVSKREEALGSSRRHRRHGERHE